MKAIFTFVAAIVVTFSAQAQSYFGGFGQPDRQTSAAVYGGNNALRGGSAHEVVVLDVRPVTIQKDAGLARSAGYSAAGAVLGGLAGSAIKHHETRRIAQVVGGLAGGAVGAMLASPSQQKGQAVIFRDISSGRVFSVVQADSNARPGQTGYAVEIGGELRFVPN